MEAFKEMIFSGNILGLIILVLLLFIFIKLLKSAGKGFLLFLALCAGIFIIAKFFPGIAEPIADFIRGGWLGKHRPDQPW